MRTELENRQAVPDSFRKCVSFVMNLLAVVLERKTNCSVYLLQTVQTKFHLVEQRDLTFIFAYAPIIGETP